MSSTLEGGSDAATSAKAVGAEWKELKDDVGHFADDAVTRGRSFAESARSQAFLYAEQRKQDAARSVADIAKSVRESGAGFKEQPNVRAFFDSAASGLDDLAGTIRERSFQEIYKEVEAVVRRRPAAVAAATFAAGFLVARFVKASSANAPAGSGLPMAPDRPVELADRDLRPNL